MTKPTQRTGLISGGHNLQRGHVDIIDEVGSVHEEHLYLVQKLDNGRELLWEADLLGVPSPDEGHGKLPPMIHIECPFCTMPPEDPTDRRALSFTYENKPYEIEPIKPIEKVVSGPMGQTTVTIDRLLHVRAPLECSHCSTTFIIRGGEIKKI